MTNRLSLSLCATIFLITAAHPTGTFAETRDQTKLVDPSAKRKVVRPQAEMPAMTARSTPGPVRANDPHDLPCPPDYMGVLYEEDANGKPVPGTETYFCVWD